MSLSTFRKKKLIKKETAAAATIIATLPVGVVFTQLATPKAIPESTTKAVPMRSRS